MTFDVRVEFERYMTDDWKWPNAVERKFDGSYIMMNTTQAWIVWQEAVKAYQQAIQPTHCNKS